MRDDLLRTAATAVAGYELSRALPGVERTVVAGVCGYEVAAICSGGQLALGPVTIRLPTITRLCAGRPWLSGLMLTGLGVHLLWSPARPATAR